MPRWISPAIYNPEELPQGFESGYSHVFGREKTQYVFTCFPKYRVQYSDGELKTLLKHAEGLEHAVTSHQILDQMHLPPAHLAIYDLKDSQCIFYMP
ncbi:hypothetical protein IWW34DRAFT_812796 [Fusarium oxysporum f. sp. albedinis]|nr:hypothetical protein IWW34DRAFT_812796 [Fusarium oxysporum f. sp. albedinis]